MNDHGSACMSRMLTALQPALGQLGSPSGTFWPGATRHFERARAYFALLPQPTDSILRAAGSKPGRFSQSEWMALLQVQCWPPQALFCDLFPASFEVNFGHASWHVKSSPRLKVCIIIHQFYISTRALCSQLSVHRTIFACVAISTPLPSCHPEAMQMTRRCVSSLCLMSKICKISALLLEISQA